MMSRFSLQRRLLSLAEGSGQRDHAAHRPYSVALYVQSGEIMPFSIRNGTASTAFDLRARSLNAKRD